MQNKSYVINFGQDFPPLHCLTMLATDMKIHEIAMFNAKYMYMYTFLKNLKPTTIPGKNLKIEKAANLWIQSRLDINSDS